MNDQVNRRPTTVSRTWMRVRCTVSVRLGHKRFAAEIWMRVRTTETVHDVHNQRRTTNGPP